MQIETIPRGSDVKWLCGSMLFLLLPVQILLDDYHNDQHGAVALMFAMGASILYHCNEGSDKLLWLDRCCAILAVVATLKYLTWTRECCLLILLALITVCMSEGFHGRYNFLWPSHKLYIYTHSLWHALCSAILVHSLLNVSLFD